MRYKIIIDTDIGDDIDDIFALTYCLCNPSFDIKLIMVSSGDNDYKAKLVAYMLERLNRTDIPIAKTINKPWGCNAQTNSISSFNLDKYKGIIYSDYEGILKKLLEQDNYYFFEFGPCNILAEYLKKNPQYINKLGIYYMGASVYRGYLNHPEPCAEYNVLMSVDATNYLFASGAKVTLLPVDCCYDIIIHNEAYQALINSNTEASKLLIELYKTWHTDYVGGSIKFDPQTSSTILYDLVVPMYFLHPENFAEEQANIEISSDGTSRIIAGENLKIITKLKNMGEIIKNFIDVIEGKFV